MRLAEGEKERRRQGRALQRLASRGVVAEGWIVLGSHPDLSGFRGVVEHTSSWNVKPDAARLFPVGPHRLGGEAGAVHQAGVAARDPAVGQGLTFQVWPTTHPDLPVVLLWDVFARQYDAPRGRDPYYNRRNVPFVPRPPET